MLTSFLLLVPAAASTPAQVQEIRPVNHLIHETSPYLLQHAHNPVDWYPWGEVALGRAKKEQKPIFLSIGYSACHWCHVMERESFENAEIAAFLNANFICIKVDREERPDLDDIYMGAVQRLTGSGGWPLSVWLTSDLKPFYGGTYFPPTSRYGRPGFLQVLTGLNAAWHDRRDEILTAADSLMDSLNLQFDELESEAGLISLEELGPTEKAWVATFGTAFDPVDGGFGQAPKFPGSEKIRFLLASAQRHQGTKAGDHARQMALLTLQKMASGGMYDRLGGGFARYSVDGQWLIPHFEKMLYDQGSLVPAYLEAWQLSGDDFYANIARQTCDYLLREMQAADGAFFSSTDADSEGEEGKFFVWTRAELEAALGNPERARFAMALYGVTTEGNFEHGRSVLRAAMSPADAAQAARLSQDQVVALVASSNAPIGTSAETSLRSPAESLALSVRADLYATRQLRVPPSTDDKILTAWNGLAIDALAQAGRLLGDSRYTAAATEAAEFLLVHLRNKDGRWLRAWRQDRAQHAAVLEDHAYLCKAFLSLFLTTGESRWLAEAEDLADRMLADFWNHDNGLFFDTDGRDEHLLQRLQQPWDGAISAPNAVALECLLTLHALTQNEKWRLPAQRGCTAVLPLIKRNPLGFASSLRIYRWAVMEPAVAVVIGNGSRTSLEKWRQALSRAEYLDALPVFSTSAQLESRLGLFQQRPAIDGKPTLYYCEGQSCQTPRTDP